MKSLWFRAVFRLTRATWTFMDPCGPRHVYVPCGHFSLIISYLFFSYYFPKRLYHPLHYQQSHDRLSPSSQHHVSLHPPIFSCLVNILLLFIRTFSPLFTCINWVDTTLYSILIWVLCSLSQTFSKSWNWLHCSLQAFGYYCQRLPGLTTKSIHYYPHSYHFRTKIYIYCTKDTASNTVFQYCATRPFGAHAHNVTVSKRPNSHDSVTPTHRLLIECHIQAATCNKNIILAVYY